MLGLDLENASMEVLVQALGDTTRNPVGFVVIAGVSPNKYSSSSMDCGSSRY